MLLRTAVRYLAMHQPNRNPTLEVLGWGLHGLGVLVTLAIALAAVFLAYRPIDHQAAAYTRRAHRLQNLLQNGARVRAEHAQLSEELALARKQADDLNRRIPDEPREADFLAQVSQLAAKAGLRIQDYRPGKVTAESTYSAMQVDLICQGEYASICNFLDGLSDLPRHSTTTRLEIESEENRQEYSAKMSLKLYFAVHGQLPSDKTTGK